MERNRSLSILRTEMSLNCFLLLAFKFHVHDSFDILNFAVLKRKHEKLLIFKRINWTRNIKGNRVFSAAFCSIEQETGKSERKTRKSWSSCTTSKQRCWCIQSNWKFVIDSLLRVEKQKIYNWTTAKNQSFLFILMQWLLNAIFHNVSKFGADRTEEEFHRKES